MKLYFFCLFLVCNGLDPNLLHFTENAVRDVKSVYKGIKAFYCFISYLSLLDSVPGLNKKNIGNLVENVRDTEEKFLSTKLIKLFELPNNNENVILTRKVAKKLLDKNKDISDLNLNFEVIKCPFENIPSVGKSLMNPNSVYVSTKFLESINHNEDILAFKLSSEISQLRKKRLLHQKDLSYRISGLKLFLNSVGFGNEIIDYDFINQLLVSSKCVIDEYETKRESFKLVKTCYNVDEVVKYFKKKKEGRNIIISSLTHCSIVNDAFLCLVKGKLQLFLLSTALPDIFLDN